MTVSVKWIINRFEPLLSGHLLNGHPYQAASPFAATIHFPKGGRLIGVEMYSQTSGCDHLS